MLEADGNGEDTDDSVVGGPAVLPRVRWSSLSGIPLDECGDTVRASGSALGDSGIDMLVELLASNTTVRHVLAGNNGITSAGASLMGKLIVTRLVGLESLILTGNRLGSSGCQHLATALRERCDLTELGLGGNCIGDTGAAALATALAGTTGRTLTHLDVSHNSITSKGARSLAAILPDLTYLNASFNPLGDAGAHSLATALQQSEADLRIVSLLVSAAALSAEGASSLSHAAASCALLQEVNLSNNNFADEGGDDCLRKVLRPLRKCPNLQSLNLRSTHLNARSITAAEDAFRDLGGSLLHLDLGYNAIGDGAVHTLLETLKKLVSLSLPKAAITDQGGQGMADWLGRNPPLSLLNLSYNRIGPNGLLQLVTALESNATLQQLHLRFNPCGPGNDDHFLKSLSRNSTLTRLDLSYSVGRAGRWRMRW
eukprot:NODE_1503_length_1510_cov_19.781656_g1356_i0.p1 GENE.NODE_1503_length_1510_cov_19.781656_g1356_i0~~NODE_1503_length_1510_cov_19.781656_g1356_i0.p1  ORF type:complete len:428 (+),score=54.54 NODE_1503_length_1510_cov_19.781656_g1356_i0:138-1421(+)